MSTNSQILKEGVSTRTTNLVPSLTVSLIKICVYKSLYLSQCLCPLMGLVLYSPSIHSYLFPCKSDPARTLIKTLPAPENPCKHLPLHLTSTHILGMKHGAEMCGRQPSRPI
jgi:hypothetical protein